MSATRDTSHPTAQEEARRLAAAIRALVRRFSISERADVACCGMTVAQAATLETLLAEGPMRPGGLTARLGVTPSTLTRNLDRLEKRDFVVRADDPGDVRATILSLTAAGRRAAARVARQEGAFAETILSQLQPGSRRQAVAVMTDLLGAVRSATEACCPGAFDHLMREFPVTIHTKPGAPGRGKRRTRS